MNKSLFFILIALFVSVRGVMELVTLPEAAQKDGAVCLDGSPAAYYFRAATTSADADKWVLFFQGGGWCYKPEDCAARAATALGSSARMPATLAIGGPLAEDAAENPDFASWNHVVFAYCDGASFTGTADEPDEVDGRKVYYRGFRNFEAVLADLLARRGLRKATQVLLSGDSAGGLAAFVHADHVAERLPATVQRYKVAPLSGLFLNHRNVADEPVYEQQIQRVFLMQNSSSGVDVHCLVSKSPRYMHLCMFGAETIGHTSAPVFVVNSVYDKWSLRCILTAEPVDAASAQNGNCTAAPGWAKCINHEACAADQWAALNTQWGDDFREMLAANRGFHNPGNGVFAHSCYLHNAEITGHWNKVTVNGVSIRKALGLWFFSNNDPAEKHTYVDCTLDGNFHCNPSCDL